MTNKIKLSVSISIAIIISLLIFWGQNKIIGQHPIYVAMIYSPDNTDGKAMYRVIQNYVDKVNSTGGINNKPLRLLSFDDENDRNKAKQIATEIVKQNKAHAVIGHYTSAACLEGGKIYKQAKIPAISATCTADNVTANNEWYFRVIPNNGFQGIFLANYIKRVLNFSEITIIYDKDSDYSKTLLNGFENSYIGLKGIIKNKLSITDGNSVSSDEDIENITKRFLQTNIKGGILLALNAEQAKKFIVSMKRKGLNYPIIGGDSIGKKTFAAQFNEYPEEKAQPGFFSDGIFAVAPMIYDVAGENAQLSRNAYINKYHEEPTWVTVTAYEAIQILVEAMRNSNIQGNDITTERRKIRDYLATRNSMEMAIEGLNGQFHFDLQGNAVKPLAIGVFKNQQLISALTQFQHVPNPTNIPNLEEELLAERIVIIAGQYMHKTNIVYTGIDFNEISNLDAKSSKYEVDFYLWFRFKKDVEADAIKFVNSVKVGFSDLKLGKPVAEKILANNVIYRAYQIKAQFKERFNFRDYPFDTQKLAIRFKHNYLTRYNIIYVVDFVGMNTEKVLDKFTRNHVFDLITDWNVNAVNLFQDITKNESTLGDPSFFGTDSSIEYSRFNAVIEVKRDVSSFVTKNLLPLLFLVGLSYLIMFLPFKEISVGAVSGTLVAVAFFHLSLANGLPTGIGYAVVLDYGFYVIYGLIIFQLFLVVVGQREVIRENKQSQQKVLLLGRIVYPVVFMCAGIITFYVYGNNIAETYTKSDKDHINHTHANKTPTNSDKVTLTLGSWRVEDVEQMNSFLAVFNQQYPNIEVKFTPFLEFVKMIRFQLKNSIAPDLFYLKSFSRSRPLSEAGYLESLTDLPGLENFNLAARNPWIDHNNEQYAIPFMAVSHAIYYNQDLFNKIKLKPPTTWEQLIVVANKIKQAGYIPFANGIKDNLSSSELIFMNLAPNFIGGREGRLKYETGQSCFNDEYVVAAFQAVADIATFLPENPQNIAEEGSRQLFLNEKAAMFMDSSTDIIGFEQANFAWDIFATPAPAGQSKYITYHPEFGITINAASKYKQEAKIFLEWLTKPETAELFSNTLPGYFPLHNQQPNLTNEHAKNFLALNTNRGKDVRWSYPNLMDGLPDGQFLMYKNTEAVILGLKTPQQAADSLQDALAQWYEPAQKCLRLKNDN